RHHFGAAGDGTLRRATGSAAAHGQTEADPPRDARDAVVRRIPAFAGREADPVHAVAAGHDGLVADVAHLDSRAGERTDVPADELAEGGEQSAVAAGRA